MLGKRLTEARDAVVSAASDTRQAVIGAAVLGAVAVVLALLALVIAIQRPRRLA